LSSKSSTRKAKLLEIRTCRLKFKKLEPRSDLSKCSTIKLFRKEPVLLK
jgi:hypothetical protein